VVVLVASTHANRRIKREKHVLKIGRFKHLESLVIIAYKSHNSSLLSCVVKHSTETFNILTMT
jgi:hypothetical protein